MIVVSPGLSQYYIPGCESSMKPLVGMMFKNLSDGTAKKYKVGTITLRNVYCNKQGSKNSAKEYDDASGHVIKKRRRVSRRMDCMARISFKFKGEHGKRELCLTFFFDYCVNADDQLTRLMWADPICRRNFTLFGDIVSFDATYSTNRYEMIFTLFTEKDNHGKCVTFGAALLSNEDNEAYSWVLDNFKVCMGRSPAMLIIDQDPGLKIAVQCSLPETRHRLCMWHIMLKVPDKVPAHLRKNDLFRGKFNNIVWSNFIEPIEFEKKWEEIMVEFGLTETSWFSSMFDIRKDWIPAYFRDFPLSGLCRTTSISESVNNYYCTFLSPKSNLVEFFMKYDSALDSQRYTYAEMNSLDESSVPLLRTPILLEKHAATVYTTSIFHKVQKEIYSACFKCRLISIVHDERQLVYEVNDGCDGIFQVRYDRDENTVVCCCAKFVRKGLLCCHIFIILKDLSFDGIPDKYVLSRWRMTSYFYTGNGGSGDLNDDMENSDGKDKLFSDFYGSAPPRKIDVLPPKFVKTKGSGSRLKPREEKQVERANKPLRTCQKYKKKSHHDARNCDKKSE
ncbi:hypothetical protein C2S52_012034 [Perilla frutescens var. hirtella]|nr:hypothetical protein C2S52_012034 [Perilla frutescens var. hirtella]